MALRKRKVDILARARISENVADLVNKDALLEADNVREFDIGAISKRYGWARDSTYTARHGSTLLPDAGDSLQAVLLADELQVFGANDTSVEGFRPVQLQFFSATDDVDKIDVAVTGSTACYFWQDSNSFLWTQLVDVTTGAVILDRLNVALVNSKNPRVLVVDGNFWLLYEVDPGTGTVNSIKRVTLSPSGTAISSASNVVTDKLRAASSSYDVHPDPRSSTQFYIAYSYASGLTIAKVTTGLTVTKYTAANTATGAIGVHAGNDGTKTVITAAYAPTGASVLNGTQIQDDMSTVVTAHGTFINLSREWYGVGICLANDTTATSTPLQVVAGNALTSGTMASNVASVNVTLAGSLSNENEESDCALVGKPFLMAPVANVTRRAAWPVAQVTVRNGVGFSRPLVSNLVFYDSNVSAVRYIATLQAAQADDRILRHIPGNASYFDGTATHQLLAQLSVSGIASITSVDFLNYSYTGIGILVDVSAESKLPKLPNVFGGGMLQAYDSRRRVYPSQMIPYIQGELTANTTGGSMADGNYSYIAVWEGRDANGILWRSAPSLEASVTISGGGGNGSVTLNTLTNHPWAVPFGGLLVTWYRTEASGTVYYRLGTGLATDTSADADITRSQLLYTTGGVLESQTPPAPTGLLYTKDRVWLIPAQNPRSVWVSKLIEQRTAPEFNAALIINLAEDVVALASVDDKVLLLGKSRVWAVTGDGPDNTGAGSFSNPEPVSRAWGCVNAHSVVETPSGVFYQSTRGLMFIDRSLQVQHIGWPVEDSVSSLTIKSGRYLDDRDEAWFLCSDGTVLVSRFDTQGWTTHTLFGSTGRNLKDIEVFGGVPYILAQNSATADELWHEDSTIFADNSEQVQMSIVTPWIRVAGITGFQRLWQIRLLLEFVDDHDLTVEIGYDGSASYSQTVTVNQDITAGDTALSPYQVSILPTREQCESFRLRIRDVSPAAGADSAAFRLLGLSLDVGVQAGSGRKQLASGALH